MASPVQPEKPPRRSSAQRISPWRSPSLYPSFCLNKDVATYLSRPLERIDAGSTSCPLIQLIPSIGYSFREKNTYSSPVYTESVYAYELCENLGKTCQNSLLSGGGRSLGAKISGGRGRPPANILIPFERQLIALQLCRWQFLYNENLQQTFRPVLSKLSKRRQI